MGKHALSMNTHEISWKWKEINAKVIGQKGRNKVQHQFRTRKFTECQKRLLTKSKQNEAPERLGQWELVGTSRSYMTTITELSYSNSCSNIFLVKSWRYEKMQTNAKQNVNHCSTSHHLYKCPWIPHCLLGSHPHKFNSESLLKRTLCSPDS